MGNIYIKFTYEHCNICHADKIAAKSIIEMSLKYQTKTVKKQYDPFKMPNKKEKKEKRIRNCFLSKQPDEIFTRVEIPTTQFTIQFFLL